MELMLIVWLVSIVSNLPHLFGTGILLIAAASVFGCMWADVSTSGKREDRFKFVKEKCMRWKTCIVFAVLITIIPSESTMKYMAGAYLLQSAYETDFAQKAIPLSQKAVLNQLEKWAEDNDELKTLLENSK